MSILLCGSRGRELLHAGPWKHRSMRRSRQLKRSGMPCKRMHACLTHNLRAWAPASAQVAALLSSLSIINAQSLVHLLLIHVTLLLALPRAQWPVAVHVLAVAPVLYESTIIPHFLKFFPRPFRKAPFRGWNDKLPPRNLSITHLRHTLAPARNGASAKQSAQRQIRHKSRPADIRAHTQGPTTTLYT